MKPTPEQLAKLPKWAQDAFRSLEGERFTAVRELKEWRDNQTPSPISIMEYVSDGEQQGPSRYDRFVQSRNLQIKWKGVSLDVGLRESGPQHDNSITLSWSAESGSTGDQVAFVPTSYQAARLISKENMRA